MATSYTPVVNILSNPLLQVVSVDTTPYDEIQASQGSVMYEATGIYIQGDSIEAINLPLEVRAYNVDGSLKEKQTFNLADPNQSQTSKNIDLKKSPIVFDGRTSISVTLLPLSTFRIYFYCFKLEPSDFLKGGGDLFDDGFLKTYGFFDEYIDEINNKINSISDDIK